MNTAVFVYTPALKLDSTTVPYGQSGHTGDAINRIVTAMKKSDLEALRKVVILHSHETIVQAVAVINEKKSLGSHFQVWHDENKSLVMMDTRLHCAISLSREGRIMINQAA